MTWKLSAEASKAEIDAALVASEDAMRWDAAVPISALETNESAGQWALECWCETRPDDKIKAQMEGLFASSAPPIACEELPPTDWVALSQQGTQPIRSGRFFVHTPDHLPSPDPALTSFCIPAAQAFGTGQHDTTRGCLALLDAMARTGLMPRNIIDVGSGTGLLAFAANILWPRARLTASDIDPVCIPAIQSNMARNGIKQGRAPGELTAVHADGLADRMLAQRAPFDLLIANILAGPLIALAPQFTAALAARGSIVLAGLLNTQANGVIRAYRRAGMRLQARIGQGDWTILWLRQRHRV